MKAPIRKMWDILPARGARLSPQEEAAKADKLPAMAAALAIEKPPQENFSPWRRRARRNRFATPDRLKRKSRYRLRRASGAPVSADGGAAPLHSTVTTLSSATNEDGIVERMWSPAGDVRWEKQDFLSALLSTAWEAGLKGRGLGLEELGKFTGIEVQFGYQPFQLVEHYDIYKQDFLVLPDGNYPLTRSTFSGYQTWGPVSNVRPVERLVDWRACIGDCP